MSDLDRLGPATPGKQPLRDLRVLHVISGINPENGGPSRALLGLTAAQTQVPGLHPTVAATWKLEPARAASAEYRDRGVEIHMFGPSRGKLSRCPGLARGLDALIADADVVHIHALFEEIQHVAAVLARRRRVPYLFRPCGMLDPWSLRQNALLKRLYFKWRLERDLRGAAAIHAVSPIEKQNVDALRLGPPTLVEYNGLDLDEFDPLPPRGYLHTLYPRIAQRPILLFLSRLHPKKGLDLLLPAFQQLVQATTSAAPFLVLAGPGDDGYVHELRREITQRDLGGHVGLTGMLVGRDRVAAMADADVFVLPSYQENFGIAVAEAMAAGLPVIVSNEVALHPLVIEYDVGAVVSPDAEELTRTLARVLADAPRRIAMGQRGRRLAFELFSWRDIAHRWRAHYQTLLG